MTTTAGLFQLDMIDHHAVLGFSLAAEAKLVRKCYLKIARKLHPDSLREASEEERKLASELLSKQINPAYEVLSQEKSCKEHKILLKMKQKQLSTNRSLVSLTSESAKALLNAQDLEAGYAAALQQAAATQFTDLTRVQSAINEISELNAVYLMRKQAATTTQTPAPASDATVLQTTPVAVPTPSPSSQAPATQRSRSNDIIQRYLKRAKEFEAQQDYSRGILEVREAIASHPKNAACHAYLSSLYLKSGQATLAKIHAKQALVFDPENQIAKTVRAQLDAQKAGGKKSANSTKNSAKSAKNAGKKAGGSQKGKKRGGLLSGLFGGNKR